ncbi:hypothetical protein AVEN_268734-1 [Araneus ventricosus]|uniref:Uncharacterized protein n=1 Tax=Araneus ventricosus TaxID=182803 RepID=A0A4Y2MIG4_ARAVE|nr:hypothetical protein AVEN_268734-1 [Araneus ventricosus]
MSPISLAASIISLSTQSSRPRDIRVQSPQRSRNRQPRNPALLRGFCLAYPRLRVRRNKHDVMKTLREAANQRARLFSLARIEVKVGYMPPDRKRSYMTAILKGTYNSEPASGEMMRITPDEDHD